MEFGDESGSQPAAWNFILVQFYFCSHECLLYDIDNWKKQLLNSEDNNINSLKASSSVDFRYNWYYMISVFKFQDKWKEELSKKFQSFPK